MRPFSKRMLSLMLAACMAGTTVPATALAASITIHDSEISTMAATKISPIITLSDTTVWYGDPVAMNTSVKLGSTTVTGTDYANQAGTLTYTYVNKATGNQVYGTPSDVGTYSVTASLAGNDTYNSVTSSAATLTIKASVTSVSMAEPTVTIPYHGSAISATDLPVNVSQSGGPTYTGEITYMTRSGESRDYEYALPVNAGTYHVKASTPASATKNATSPTVSTNETTLTIETATTTIVVPKTTTYTYTGNAVDFKASAYLNKGNTKYQKDISEKIAYSYTGTVNGQTVKGTGLPKEKGTYTITMTVDGTNNYEAASETATITIGEPTIEFDMERSYSFSYIGKAVTLTGVKATLNGTTDLTGKITYSYSTQGSSVQRSGLPTDVGTYTVTATVPKTSTYAEASETCTVTISQAAATITLPATKTVAYTGKVIDAPATAVFNKGAKFETDCSSLIHYYYRIKGSSDSYNSGLPSNTGTYTIRAEIEDSVNYSGQTVTGEVTISASAATITMPTKTSYTYTGKPLDYTATAAMGSQAITGILYQYKASGAADSAYVSGLPTKVGTYVIQAALASNQNYTCDPKTATVTITQAKPTVTLTDKAQTYNGKPVEMEAKVKLLADDAYTVTPTYSYKLASKSDASYTTINASHPFPTNAGTYTIKAEIKVAGGQYETATETATLTINPIELDLTWAVDCEDGCMHDGKVHTATPTIVSTGKILDADKGKLSVTAPDGSQTKAGTYSVKAVFIGDAAANYAATSSTGTYQFVISEHPHELETFVEPATLTKDGATVTKCILPDCDYVKTSKTIASPDTITLAKSAYVYSGKIKTPTVKVYDTDGGRIASSNYTVSYPNGRKNIGTRTVEIEFTGEKYIGTMSAEFVINPPASSVKSLKVGKTYITVGFKAVSGSVSGYEIQYATKSSFSNAQSIKASNTRVSKMVKSLKSGQKYYVRVRSYKKVSGTTYYSAWCKAKSTTTKK